MNSGELETGHSPSSQLNRNSKPSRELRALKNILELEQKLEFTNRAVMGGLDSFIEQIPKSMQWILKVEPLSGSRYAVLEPGQRHRWASLVLARLNTPTAEQANSRTAQQSGTKKVSNKRGNNDKNYTLDTALENLKFIHKSTRQKLKKIGVGNLRDIIHLFPNRHIDYSQVTKIVDAAVGEQMTVAGRVIRTEIAKIGPRPGAAKIFINDGSGVLEATFFRQAYLAGKFKQGALVAFSGEIRKFNSRYQMQNPEYDLIPSNSLSASIKDDTHMTHAGNLLPVYPSTEGLLQRSIRTATRKSLDYGLPLVKEFLSDELRKRHSFENLTKSIESMHYPSSPMDYSEARRRMAFDELFIYQLAALKKKTEWQNRIDGIAINHVKARPVIDAFLNSLGFDLTKDQQNALNQLVKDMGSGVPMGRLLQGEVGSGKTVVALASLLAVNASGYQGALMAPTEVLAEQHFLNASNQINAESMSNEPKEAVLQANLPGSIDTKITIVLLIGSLKPSIKKRVQQIITNGDADLIIGTHALLQEQISIPKLGLAVVDEQHRFGVEQRSGLTRRKPRPHLLAMSATPIPRTLSLTIYGDLDITTLKLLPKGRKPINTTLANNETTKKDAYEIVRREVAKGRQAFVVCPLIEPSDSVDAASAIQEFERLSNNELRELQIGLLHGRMSLAEKQDVMEKFRHKSIDVLVATPVIEVGVDIPNATVMIIMSADRFGLAQLHQLRGRVGRGGNKSFCVLLPNSQGKTANSRIQAILDHTDGFKLAEEDLRIRGPGDYIGTRQSGWDELKVATIDDTTLLLIARSEALNLIKNGTLDAIISNESLSRQLERVTSSQFTEFS